MHRPHRSENPDAITATTATKTLPPAAAGFDGGRLDELITQGEWVATAAGPLPAPAADDPLAFLPTTATAALPIEWIEQERAVLAAVLVGLEDHSARWGLFRRRIGLRYDQPVPPRLWSTPEHRLVAEEVDALFRGEREVRILNAESIRQDVRSRLAGGRFQGSLQRIESALADLLAWAQLASPLDFPIAC